MGSPATRLGFGARALLLSWAAAVALGCTSNGSNPPPTPDASSPDTSAPPPADMDAGAAEDSYVAPIVDANVADVADAAPDATTCAWTGTYESPACSTCLRASCCGATTTCEDDPQCVALDSCVNACLTADAGQDGGTVSTCAQACADEQTAPVRNEWNALNNCLELDCYNGGAGPCL